ncbi:MAG: alpha-(1-_3)-arabinofuranosyltransferase family protein, partial [Acidimicrobiia bacterium]
MNTLRKHANRWSIALTAALAYVPLLLTEPGRVAADTKQYLYLDPSRLLSRAATMWDSHIGLGTVTHQNIGYLFPMGPYYWLMERLGVPDWVAQRLWLGSIMFLAALGVRYLMRTLGASQFAAGIAGLVYMLSPYSLDYAARISVILLPWAALGWMLGLTIRAAHLNRWREAAAFALVVQVVGGVNATALIFAGLAPLLWLGIAVLTKSLPWRRVFSTTARIGVMSLLTSLWWMAGLSMQGAYGIDILRFTETVKAVSGASMSGEVLRGLGYWFFYGTDKVGPWIEASGNYTQSTWLIAIGYLVPAAALAAAVLVRWRHRRFFISLMVLGMAIAVGTHPYANPAPFGALLKAFARASSAGLALRSTGRAVPIVSLGIAAFCGVGAHALRAWLKVQSQRSVRLLGTATGAIVTVIAVAGFTPIWNHEYYASSLLRNETIPKYWTQAIADADKGDHKTRIFEVPGSDFATYRWGGLVDPVTPGLTDRPYLARELIPWGSPASADLVNAFDRQLQEGALEPTAVQPMARLFAAGTVLARNDLQIDRYNLVRPNEVATVLEQGGLQVAKRYGFEPLSPLKFPLLDERTLGASGLTQPQIPSVVRYEVPGVPKILAVVSANQPVIIEGDGEGVVNAAASGFVPSDRVVIQAASLATEPESLLREAARPGAQLVVTDTNRNRA